jgi:2,3-dihydroxybenzoate decarboxylase
VEVAMLDKIAVEEHFLAPDFMDYWQGTVVDVPPPVRDALVRRLTDFDETRLEIMDRTGIRRAVLSISGPGVQIERDVALATRRAAAANDFLARQIERHPTRYMGFAHLALQDPREAARELQRCVVDLRFRGAMINGHTLGRYLDDRACDVFWEKAQELRAPIYIHPADPLNCPESFADYKALARATWGWTVETASHALRLIFGGVFDRFPEATLVLGHMGETLPYLLWRLDSRAKLYGVTLRKSPSDYIRDNIAISISGVYSPEPLACAIAALGASRILFAADYPYESAETAASFIETVAIEEAARVAICFGNARRIFQIP